MTRALLVRLSPRLAGDTDEQSYPYPTGGRSSKPGLGSRAAGESYISKTVSYSVNYSSKPQRRDSDSMVQLVEVGPSGHEHP